MKLSLKENRLYYRHNWNYIRIRNNWKVYYPVYCNECSWVGSSEDVIGSDDGPFMCPYCYTMDPTDHELSRQAYYPLRIVSLLMQPARYIYKRYLEWKLNRYYAEKMKEYDKK